MVKQKERRKIEAALAIIRAGLRSKKKGEQQIAKRLLVLYSKTRRLRKLEKSLGVRGAEVVGAGLVIDMARIISAIAANRRLPRRGEGFWLISDVWKTARELDRIASAKLAALESLERKRLKPRPKKSPRPGKTASGRRR